MISFQRSHAIFSIFLEICFLACWNDATGNRLLSGDSGIFSAPQEPMLPFVREEYNINARPNHLITVQVFVFDALEQDRDMIVFHEGRRGAVSHYYHKRGEDIIHGRTDTSDKEIVTLPFTFNSTTNNIRMNYITLYLKNQGFVARYEEYPNNLCTKSSLIEDTTQLTCTRYSIAPKAANCSYVKDCGAHFVTRGYAKCDKETGAWHDTSTCIADPIRAKQCDIKDHGSYTMVTNCVYSLSAIIRYYKTMHESHDWENFKFSVPRKLNFGFLVRCNGCRKISMFYLRILKQHCYYWHVRNFPLCVRCRFLVRCSWYRNK